MGSGSTHTPQHASQQWELDTLGNWSDRFTDADHDGSFVDYDGVGYKDGRLHNAANEIESGLQYDQRIFSSGTTPVYRDHHYDDTGNMTDERRGTALPAPGTLMAGQVHAYDAWNRLIESSYVTSGGSATMISQNTYNALGWRTSRAFDESKGAYDGIDQKRVYSYGADWRLLEERIDTDVSANSDSLGGDDDDVDWVSQQFWGLRYIDDAVGKRVDRDGDGDFVDSDCTYWYQLSDTQFSVGVVLNGDGNVYERIEYDAYGVARQRWGGDADGDGAVSNADMSLNGGENGIHQGGYHADLDVNCDGVFDGVDIGVIMGNTPFSPFPYPALPGGWIGDPSSNNGPDNWVGYAGYVFNHEREDYTVRFRVYIPELGRWMQNDPIGSRNHLIFERPGQFRAIDIKSSMFAGNTRYEYAYSSPTLAMDPGGLSPGGGQGTNWGSGDPNWVNDVHDTPLSPLWRNTGSKGNCYRYACNDPMKRGEDHSKNPSGVGSKPMTCDDVMDGARADGLLDPCPDGTCPEGSTEVAAAVAPAGTPGMPSVGDFHWYVKGGDGTWYHKAGNAPAQNETYPNSMTPYVTPDTPITITDPSDSSQTQPYQPCGSLCVPAGGVNLD